MESITEQESIKSDSELATNNRQQNRLSKTIANTFLKYSAMLWFIAILAGQWLFFYYIMAFYGFSVINDNMEIWNRWEPLGNTPYHAGDTAGNLAFAAHAIGAGIVAFGGAIQLMPKVRAIAPKFHKINGYVYLITVFFLAISGFYLSWVRGSNPSFLAAVGTSINGFLILIFAFLTLKTAMARKIANHRKWAIRLFLVSNAQWFLRVGVFAYMISGTVVGSNPAFGDPFFPFWTFGCFLVPLAAAELYFYATEKRSVRLKYVAAVVITLLTLFMAIGVFGLTPFLMQVMSGEPISLQ